jgi:hypothetical protein
MAWIRPGVDYDVTDAKKNRGIAVLKSARGAFASLTPADVAPQLLDADQSHVNVGRK